MTKQVRIFRLYAILVAAALPVLAQNQVLNGSVLTAETGTPIPDAPVIAYQKTATHSQRPLAYSAHTDRTGSFTMTIAPVNTCSASTARAFTWTPAAGAVQPPSPSAPAQSPPRRSASTGADYSSCVCTTSRACSRRSKPCTAMPFRSS